MIISLYFDFFRYLHSDNYFKYTCTYRHVFYIIPIFKPNTIKLSNVQSVVHVRLRMRKAVILWYLGFARFQTSVDLTNNFFISLK